MTPQINERKITPTRLLDHVRNVVNGLFGAAYTMRSIQVNELSFTQNGVRIPMSHRRINTTLTVGELIGYLEMARADGVTEVVFASPDIPPMKNDGKFNAVEEANIRKYVRLITALPDNSRARHSISALLWEQYQHHSHAFAAHYVAIYLNVTKPV